MFENSYSILDLLGWLFVGVAIGACVLYFALWAYAVRRASGLTKRAADGGGVWATKLIYRWQSTASEGYGEIPPPLTQAVRWLKCNAM